MTAADKARAALALLRKHRDLIRFVHPFECHHTRGSDCTCGAEDAKRDLDELLGPKPTAPEGRMKGRR